MRKFELTYQVMVPQCTTILVEADNIKEAIVMAKHDLASTDDWKSFWDDMTEPELITFREEK